MADQKTDKTAKPESSRTAQLSASTVKKIRDMRATKGPDGEKAKHTHKAIADKFGTSPGIVSAICRNKSYFDPEYTPVNDTPWVHAKPPVRGRVDGASA